MQRAGEGCVAHDRLGEQLGMGGNRRGREPEAARDHVGQPAHDDAAGIEPDARLYSNGCVPARRLFAALDIGVVEPAREELAQMRQLGFADAGVVLCEGMGDLRNLRRAGDECVDRLRQVRLEDGPEPLQARAGVLVEAVGLEPWRKFGLQLVLDHRSTAARIGRKGGRGEHARR
jgi:hypothetical protein